QLLHPVRLPLFPTRRSSDLQIVREAVPVRQHVRELRILEAIPNSRNHCRRYISAVDESRRDLLRIHRLQLRRKERRIGGQHGLEDRKSTRLNSSHEWISYAV